MNITRRDLLLLIVIWAIVGVLALGSIIALRHIRPATGPSSDQPELTVTSTLVPAYTPVPSQVTAMTQYPLAQEKASGWRDDAQLVSCRGTWEQTAINLVGKPIEWDYRFYSAQAKLLYFVTVTPDGRVNATQHLGSVNRPPPALPVHDWQVDSPAALANWLNAGGGRFLVSRPGIDVVAQLSLRSADADPEWTVVGYDRSTEDYFSVAVQARSGDTAVLAQRGEL